MIYYADTITLENNHVHVILYKTLTLWELQLRTSKQSPKSM